MNVGELWVAHPIFPWLVLILGFWVMLSTIVQARSWFFIRKLEQHNKLLQIMLLEGIGSVVKRFTAIENRIRSKEQQAAATEETVEDWDDESASGSQNSTRAESPSSEENQPEFTNTGSRSS